VTSKCSKTKEGCRESKKMEKHWSRCNMTTPAISRSNDTYWRQPPKPDMFTKWFYAFNPHFDPSPTWLFTFDSSDLIFLYLWPFSLGFNFTKLCFQSIKTHHSILPTIWFAIQEWNANLKSAQQFPNLFALTNVYEIDPLWHCHGLILRVDAHLGSILSTFFEQILRTQIPKVQKIQSSHQSFLRFRDLSMQNLLTEHWWNWHMMMSCRGMVYINRERVCKHHLHSSHFPMSSFHSLFSAAFSTKILRHVPVTRISPRNLTVQLQW